MDGISRSRGWDKEIPHGVLPMKQLVLSDKWARKTAAQLVLLGNCKCLQIRFRNIIHLNTDKMQLIKKSFSLSFLIYMHIFLLLFHWQYSFFLC